MNSKYLRCSNPINCSGKICQKWNFCNICRKIRTAEICTICFFDGLPKDFMYQDFFNVLKKFLYDFISKIWLPHNIVSNYNIIFWICVMWEPSVFFLVFTHKIEGNEGEIEVTAKWQMSDRIIDVLCGLFMRL